MALNNLQRDMDRSFSSATLLLQRAQNSQAETSDLIDLNSTTQSNTRDAIINMYTSPRTLKVDGIADFTYLRTDNSSVKDAGGLDNMDGPKAGIQRNLDSIKQMQVLSMNLHTAHKQMLDQQHNLVHVQQDNFTETSMRQMNQFNDLVTFQTRKQMEHLQLLKSFELMESKESGVKLQSISDSSPQVAVNSQHAPTIGNPIQKSSFSYNVAKNTDMESLKKGMAQVKESVEAMAHNLDLQTKSKRSAQNKKEAPLDSPVNSKQNHQPLARSSIMQDSSTSIAANLEKFDYSLLKHKFKQIQIQTRKIVEDKPTIDGGIGERFRLGVGDDEKENLRLRQKVGDSINQISIIENVDGYTLGVKEIESLAKIDVLPATMPNISRPPLKVAPNWGKSNQSAFRPKLNPKPEKKSQDLIIQARETKPSTAPIFLRTSSVRPATLAYLQLPEKIIKIHQEPVSFKASLSGSPKRSNSPVLQQIFVSHASKIDPVSDKCTISTQTAHIEYTAKIKSEPSVIPTLLVTKPSRVDHFSCAVQTDLIHDRDLDVVANIRAVQTPELDTVIPVSVQMEVMQRILASRSEQRLVTQDAQLLSNPICNHSIDPHVINTTVPNSIEIKIPEIVLFEKLIVDESMICSFEDSMNEPGFSELVSLSKIRLLEDSMAIEILDASRMNENCIGDMYLDKSVDIGQIINNEIPVIRVVLHENSTIKAIDMVSLIDEDSLVATNVASVTFEETVQVQEDGRDNIEACMALGEDENLSDVLRVNLSESGNGPEIMNENDMQSFVLNEKSVEICEDQVSIACINEKYRLVIDKLEEGASMLKDESVKISSNIGFQSVLIPMVAGIHEQIPDFHQNNASPTFTENVNLFVGRQSTSSVSSDEQLVPSIQMAFEPLSSVSFEKQLLPSIKIAGEPIRNEIVDIPSTKSSQPFEGQKLDQKNESVHPSVDVSSLQPDKSSSNEMSGISAPSLSMDKLTFDDTSLSLSHGEVLTGLYSEGQIMALEHFSSEESEGMIPDDLESLSRYGT